MAMESAPVWLINSFGVTAGLCSMASFLPQIWKITRTKDASGVSLRMYAVTIVGFVCWTVFGALSQSWPVTLANGVCLVLVSIILVLRLRFGGGNA